MKLNSGDQTRAMIIGCEEDSFVREVINLLGEHKIYFELRPNIYSAAGSLAKSYAGDTLVIGRLSEMSRENGEFFNITGGNNYLCCCFVDGKNTQSQISRAKEAGITLITKLEELEEVICTVTGGRQSPQMKIENIKIKNFTKEDFAPSAAELDALLGT